MYIKSKNGTSERSEVEVELDHTLMGRIGRDGRVWKMQCWAGCGWMVRDF